MRNPGGCVIITDPYAPVREVDTFTCCHCNSIVKVEPGARAEDCGGFCRMCMAPVCPKCADGPCVPFEKKLEAEEAAYRARRSYGLEG